MKRTFPLLLSLVASACKKPAPTPDAATTTSTTATAAPDAGAADAGDLTDDDVEFGDPPDAGCPIPVHPGYCRNRCKGFAARKMSHHAARMSDPTRYAVGTCGTYDVFAERDARDAGITEYYELSVLVAARDDRQRGCTDFGTVPKCELKLDWKPEASVKFGQPTVTKGNLPPEVISRITRQRIYALKACYQTALDRDATIHGTFVLAMTISATGEPTVSKAKESTVADAALGTCILDTMKATSFPTPDPPGPVTVTMTLTLGPA